ncbi:RapZ C-terminal domain-containing protein [Saccharothrix sp. Mg75]|uniref:RapZ C-terminal domain-containing protein n=1 Tax=Saccharothrix sp. Mg75 TaxID=3445357 RepID=UPI003EEE6934
MSEPTTAALHVISFGYLHGQPPVADLVVDVRELLRDPARARNGGFLDLDGRHPVVRDAVMTTPGALDLAGGVYFAAFQLHTVAGKPVTLAFGCAGGRHRSVALAEHVANLFLNDPEGDDIPVRVSHLHVHLPRVLRDGDDRREGTR